ncbi:MAG: polysaccharide biosynthesis/export family protein [Planctomycetes bacterium]|nr:polysaccharide biosynthesis/export family protein [Planctomycetota bacterium]
MRSYSSMVITVVLALLWGSGCNGNNRAMQARLIKMARNPVVEAEYRIAPPDQLSIEIKGYPEYSRQVMVRPDGKITVTSVGDIYVTGMTTLEAAEAIRTALLAELSQPSVTVALLAANSKAIYLFGEIRRPGLQTYHGDMTLLDALAAAGGLTFNADAAKLSVTRISLDKPEVLKINLRKLVYKGAAEQNVALKEGDIVYVAPTGFAKVGYAMNQLLFPFKAGLGALSTYGNAENALDDD